MVDTDFDGDGGVDQTNQSGRNTNEVGGASVGCASVASDIGDETTYT